MMRLWKHVEAFEDSIPEVTLTDEDIEYIDEFLDDVGAATAGVNYEEVPESVSDQDHEEYARQFNLDQINQPEQENLEDVTERHYLLLQYRQGSFCESKNNIKI